MALNAQLVGAAIAILSPCLGGPAVGAFIAGPGRAEIAGYAPDDARVFFRLHAPDEASPPRAYYFDLRGAQPGRAIRAYSLEDSDTTFAGDWAPPAWEEARRRLAPLVEDRAFNYECSVRAEPVGRNRSETDPSYRLAIELQSADVKARVVLSAYCNTLVGVKGIYRIPGRSERLVILSYSGSPDGCQDVEQPVLLE